MAIDPKEVEHVAYLSRLELSDEAMARFGEQLGHILDYIEKLGELDTSGVAPMLHAIDLQNVTREDGVGESLPHEEALQNAPESSEGCFKVPRIID